MKLMDFFKNVMNKKVEHVGKTIENMASIGHDNFLFFTNAMEQILKTYLVFRYIDVIHSFCKNSLSLCLCLCLALSFTFYL